MPASATFASRATLRFARSVVVLACCGAIPVGSVAAEGESPVAFDLAADALEPALKQFSAQSGRQVIFPTELASGVRTREVQGPLTAQAALERMLAGTPLTAKPDATGAAFAIVRRSTNSAARGATLNARAVIVIGLTADDAQARRMRSQAETAHAGFVARGVPADAIAIVPPAGALARRDAVLAALRSGNPSVTESWVLLLGQIAPGRDGAPAFQVSGPRLLADEFAAAVAALPGKKHVVIATARSGGFLAPLLAVPEVEAVAATAASGEINEPSFAQMWVDALAAVPQASFRALAADAAQRVEALYEQRQLGRGEHAQLIDRATGKIVEAPFSAETSAPTAVSSPR